MQLVNGPARGSLTICFVIAAFVPSARSKNRLFPKSADLLLR